MKNNECYVFRKLLPDLIIDHISEFHEINKNQRKHLKEIESSKKNIKSVFEFNQRQVIFTFNHNFIRLKI